MDIPKVKPWPSNSAQCNICGGHGCMVCDHKGWLVPRLGESTNPYWRRCWRCGKPLAPNQLAVYCTNDCAFKDVVPKCLDDLGQDYGEDGSLSHHQIKDKPKPTESKPVLATCYETICPIDSSTYKIPVITGLVWFTNEVAFRTWKRANIGKRSRWVLVPIWNSEGPPQMPDCLR